MIFGFLISNCGYKNRTTSFQRKIIFTLVYKNPIITTININNMVFGLIHIQSTQLKYIYRVTMSWNSVIMKYRTYWGNKMSNPLVIMIINIVHQIMNIIRHIMNRVSYCNYRTFFQNKVMNTWYDSGYLCY